LEIHNLIWSLFVHRTDTFGLQLPSKFVERIDPNFVQEKGSYYRIPSSLTVDSIKNHIEGKETIAVYIQDKESGRKL